MPRADKHQPIEGETDPGHLQEITASVVICVALFVMVFLLYGPERLSDDALELVAACTGAGIAVVLVRSVVTPRGVAIGSAMLTLVAWGAIFHGGRNEPRPGFGARSLLLWTGGSSCPIGTPNVVPGDLCWDMPHVTLISFVGAALLGLMAFLIQLGVPLIILRAGKTTVQRMVSLVVAAILLVGPAVGFLFSEAASVLAGLLGYIGGLEVTVTVVGALATGLDFALKGQPTVQLVVLAALVAAGLLLVRRGRKARGSPARSLQEKSSPATDDPVADSPTDPSPMTGHDHV